MSSRRAGARRNRTGGIKYRLNYLVIAGASAEITRKRVTNLRLGRVRIAIQQRFRRHQEARRADTALQARVLEELLLQDVQVIRGRESLDRLDLLALHLGTHYQARACGPPVHDNSARAAVTGQAPFFATGQVELVAQAFEQALTRLAPALHRVAAAL